MRYLGFLLISIFLFSGCTPEKRLARIIKYHPELTRTVYDTIKFDTLIVVPAIKSDFSGLIKKNDSLIFDDNGLKVSIFLKENRNNPDSIFVKVDKKQDSIPIHKEFVTKTTVIEPKITLKESKDNKNRMDYKSIAIYLLLFLLLIAVIIYLIKKR